jgi:hypothetical protein
VYHCSCISRQVIFTDKKTELKGKKARKKVVPKWAQLLRGSVCKQFSSLVKGGHVAKMKLLCLFRFNCEWQAVLGWGPYICAQVERGQMPVALLPAPILVFAVCLGRRWKTGWRV